MTAKSAALELDSIILIIRIIFMSGEPRAQRAIGHTQVHLHCKLATESLRVRYSESAAGTWGRYAQACSIVNSQMHPCSLQVYTSFLHER